MRRHTVLDRRRAGVLLHPASLPGGDFGPDAYRFVDFLAAAGLSVWQMLPLGPTHADGSPYHSQSVHALGADFIHIDRLPADLGLPAAPAGASRAEIMDHLQNVAQQRADAGLAAFLQSENHWLDNYALYQALRAEHGQQPWWTWPAELRNRAPASLQAARKRCARKIQAVQFEQYAVARQYQALRQYAHLRGVLMFGDMPIFIAHDSAEVWADRDYFKLDSQDQPEVVAGVPPDYFSDTGQRWGNPLYRWERMQQDGFRWWQTRLQTELGRFDLLRIDHFRGFEACWEIPAGDDTAVNGRWVKVPGEALIDAWLTQFPALPLVAEDLGMITPEVTALRDKYGLPGMLVLQFAFYDSPDNPYLPHRHVENAVVYTGTHDNDTTLAWYQELPAPVRQKLRDYLAVEPESMPGALVRAAFMSVARLAVIPMQDLLGLGRGHRTNLPGTRQGNWTWRFEWSQCPADLAGRIRKQLEIYARAG